MSRKVFRQLKTIEEVKEIIRKYFNLKPKREIIPLDEALDRVIFEDIDSPIDIPGFDRASMDGYALIAEDTYGADETKPVYLKLAGKIEAGEIPEIKVKHGECVAISTGAPIPAGANSVIMVEYTSIKNGLVSVMKPVTPGENIQATGSDIMQGEIVLRKNQIITSREIGVAAAMGLKFLPVYARPKIAVLSTGNEITPLGDPLEYGKIYDINSHTIMAVVREAGGEPFYLGCVKDAEQEIKKTLFNALGKYDIILTSGSTSAGFGDIMYNILNDLGEPGVLVHGVAVKPGKPTIVALAQNSLIVSLPGYPVSALSIFNIIVKPIILELAGRGEAGYHILEGILTRKVISETGRHEILPVHISNKKGVYYIYPITKGSGAITALAEADGFIEIPENRVILEEGERLLTSVYSNLKPANLIVIGSHCPVLDLILEFARGRNPSLKYKIINVGSLGGIQAIKRGEADIAGVHLLDEATGEYNIPFILKENLQEQTVLIKGYTRLQGIIVSEGNPKNIKTIGDIIDNKLTIINRVKGSGTRILLDNLIKDYCLKRGLDFKKTCENLPGYNVEAKTHSSVAVAVKHGKADAGICLKFFADFYGLTFISLKEEEYDFLVGREDLDREEIKLFIEVLKNREFHKIVYERLKGVKFTDCSGSIINM
ncbi:MAG: molybdopterin biosynthesis protein [Candidatus Odinarchaeum yellowstonii]|uniref:Molybdopterin biosynthesis protein n=1 Tax=Odinarchaeota yellowstonii (strain LCB_4) TaxID=1841599 RepID=A0AAF0IB15_ODILC|nr:MAG: molybdopterin biosynthesis protein [Candidatus Odinarchaeum yellowstonii]